MCVCVCARARAHHERPQGAGLAERPRVLAVVGGVGAVCRVCVCVCVVCRRCCSAAGGVVGAAAPPGSVPGCPSDIVAAMLLGGDMSSIYAQKYIDDISLPRHIMITMVCRWRGPARCLNTRHFDIVAAFVMVMVVMMNPCGSAQCWVAPLISWQGYIAGSNNSNIRRYYHFIMIMTILLLDEIIILSCSR